MPIKLKSTTSTNIAKLKTTKILVEPHDYQNNKKNEKILPKRPYLIDPLNESLPFLEKSKIVI